MGNSLDEAIGFIVGILLGSSESLLVLSTESIDDHAGFVVGILLGSIECTPE